MNHMGQKEKDGKLQVIQTTQKSKVPKSFLHGVQIMVNYHESKNKYIKVIFCSQLQHTKIIKIHQD